MRQLVNMLGVLLWLAGIVIAQGVLASGAIHTRTTVCLVPVGALSAYKVSTNLAVFS